jgi:hypothetical protein
VLIILAVFNNNLIALHPTALQNVSLNVGADVKFIRTWVLKVSPPTLPVLVVSSKSVMLVSLSSLASSYKCEFFATRARGATDCKIGGKCTCDIGQKCCQVSRDGQLPFACHDADSPECAVEPIPCQKLGTCGCSE